MARCWTPSCSQTRLLRSLALPPQYSRTQQGNGDGSSRVFDFITMVLCVDAGRGKMADGLESGAVLPSVGGAVPSSSEKLDKIDLSDNAADGTASRSDGTAVPGDEMKPMSQHSAWQGQRANSSRVVGMAE
ncbi:uncharacterized protein LOC135089108 [Scylla paramamosain]|uniref:uncharacterized protein LOC135089108 n=1 Tax=Scylla paramamosain TaxID=85552 RepID=UPI003082B335